MSEVLPSLDVGDRYCPSCRESLDRAAGVGTPKPGDLTLCAYCYVFLVFTEDSYRLLSDGEWLAFPTAQRQYLTFLRDGVRRIPKPPRLRHTS